MTEKDLQVADRKDSLASQGTENSERGSNDSAKESKRSGSKSHKSRKAQASSVATEDGVRKYGQVGLRAPIKKGAYAVSAERKLEDVGAYIKREVFENTPAGHSAADSEQQQKLAAHALYLHDELLETEVKEAGFDRFAGQYDPRGDTMIAAGFSRVRADEERAAQDKGTSLSRERFSAKYWGTWRADVMILEKTSAEQETPTKKELKKYEELKKQKEKAALRVRRDTPSKLPGTSFAAGQNMKHGGLLFDSHMQGTRNTPAAIMEHSMREPPPVAFHTPSALLPADSDPYRFGHSISGGVIAQGPARGARAKLASANIDFPPVDVPKGDPKLLSFGAAKRLTKTVQCNESRDAPAATASSCPLRRPGNKFGEEARTGGIPDSRRSHPGPGTYDVQGIFDRFDVPDYPRMIDAIAKSGVDFRAIPSVDLAKIGAFAYGCSRQEHVLYGFCLDGQCHKRVEFERAILQTKNYKRLGAENQQELAALLRGGAASKAKPAPEKEESKPDLDILNIDSAAAMARLQKKYSGGEQRAALRREYILSTVPGPKEDIAPLHMAAARADVHAIKKMRVLGLDINLQRGENARECETPLHLAVRNQHLNALKTIINVFDGVVDVNIQNNVGDTALHLASRKGFKGLVEALCDAEANPLLKNHAGLAPLQEARSFPIQQLLRLQSDLFKLRAELAAAEAAVAKEKGKELLLAKMHAGGGGVDLGTYMGHLNDAGDMSAAGMVPSPRRSAIVSSRGSAAPSSRSKILEMTQGTFDADVDKSKINTSLFRVARVRTTLKDPRVNSYLMGYWADEHEK